MKNIQGTSQPKRFFYRCCKTTCFLADMSDFAAFNEVYAKYFTGKPARSCVAVKDLPKGVLCEWKQSRSLKKIKHRKDKPNSFQKQPAKVSFSAGCFFIYLSFICLLFFFFLKKDRFLFPFTYFPTTSRSSAR